MYRPALSAFALILVPAAAIPAAAEVCVNCSGPSATYRCTVDDADKVEGYRQSKRVLQLVCITELAKAGGHEKCSVGRAKKGDCFGLPRSVSLTDSLDALASPAQPETIADGHGAGDLQPEAAEPPPQPKKPGPPKTVEELARRSSPPNLGRAARKSWRCLTSLFQNC